MTRGNAGSILLSQISTGYGPCLLVSCKVPNIIRRTEKIGGLRLGPASASDRPCPLACSCTAFFNPRTWKPYDPAQQNKDGQGRYVHAGDCRLCWKPFPFKHIKILAVNSAKEGTSDTYMTERDGVVLCDWEDQSNPVLQLFSSSNSQPLQVADQYTQGMVKACCARSSYLNV
jgi:hypothetical protein